MEPKVVMQSIQTAKHSGHWVYSKRQCFSQKAGSGNNWAYGYNHHGPQNETSIEELIQYQLEKCDRFDGFMCLMSLAGGTGSGLGTFVTEMLRDNYKKAFIINQVVSPYRSGEVIVQNYNSLLTLAHLYETSDGLIVIENDHIQQICSRLLGIKQVSFHHLNKVIAHKMAALLAPAQHLITNAANHIGLYAEQLYTHPGYKLSSLLTIPLMAEASIQFSTFQWAPLIRNIRQMLIAKAHMEEGINWGVKVRAASNYNKSVCNLLVLRGENQSNVDLSSLKESEMYPSWLPAHHHLSTYCNSRTFSGYEKSASLLTNSQICVDPIDKIIDKAWNMYISKAYLHQYTRHGLTEQHFTDCFDVMEKVLYDYKKL